jgi:WD40 repeat protein
VAGGLREGDEVGPFRVVREIGRGGFGRVFLARDVRLGRRVALKVITGPTSGGLAEARAAAQLSHPNIVTVYDVGEHAGCPYLALEYVAGDTLRVRMERGRLPLAEGLRLACDLAAAVAAAHAAGVAHLDLTPRNVIIGDDGRLRVVDFGLARLLGEPVAGQPLAGTPGYMAPEQWLGGDIGPAADVWALGIILHELATGEHPLGAMAPHLVRHRVCEPRPLPLAGAALPPAVAELIARCLDRVATGRPSAPEVAERLRAVARQVRPADTEAPFRGLVALDETSAASFGGRDDDIAALVERLRSAAAACVVGPSGAGKSSLLRAGLAPRLRACGWTVVVVRPGRDPLAALRSALGDRAMAAAGETLASQSVTAGEPSTVTDAIERWRRAPALVGMDLADAAMAAGATIAVIVDPLEEVETLVEAADRDRVVETLAGLADDPAGPVRAIFGVRDDFLGRIAARLPDGASLGHVHVLSTPGPSLLRAVLERPVAAAGYQFEDGIVDDVVQSVRSEAAALSLIQVAGAMLWERRDETRRRLLRAAYDEIGGVAGALAQHADRALTACSVGQVETARAMLLRLVAADGTRRPRTPADLLDALAPDADAVLDRLVAARLITARRSAGDGGEELELGHELLAERWHTLARWIDETRGDRASLEHVIAAAARWQRRGRRDDELWRGDDLVEARRCLERSGAAAPASAAAFVAAGVRRDRRRRWRARLAVAAALGALALVGVVFAAQRRDARRHAALASSREATALVEAAWSSLASDAPVEARALLRAAAEIDVSPAVRALDWRLGLEPTRWRQRLPAEIVGLAWLGDDQLAVVSLDTAVRVLDAATGAVRVLGHHGDLVIAVSASPVAREIVTGGADHAVYAWPLDGGPRRLVGRHTAPVQAVAHARDGASIASGDAVGLVIVRAAADGAEQWRADVGNGVYGLAYVGDQLVVVTADGTASLVGRDRNRRLPIERVASAAGADHELVLGTDDGRVVSLAIDGTVRAQRSAHLGRVAHVELAGPLLVSAGTDGAARVWARDDPRPIAEAALGGLPVAVARLDGSRRRLALSGMTQLEIVAITGARLAPDAGFPGTVVDVTFADEGRLLVAGGEGDVLRSFAVATGAPVAIRASGHGLVRALVSDGGDLYSGGQDGRVRRWRASDLSGGAVVGVHAGPVVDLAAAPDGGVVSGSLDRSLRLWRAGGSVALDAGAPVAAVAVAAGAQRIVGLTDDRRVLAWRLDGTGSAELRMRMHGNTADVVGLPDGRRIALLGEPPQVLLDLASGERRTFDTPVRLYAGSPDPTGTRLVVVGASGYGAVIDLDGGSVVPLGGHRWSFLDTRFGPDGHFVATAGEDGLAGLWRAGDGGFAWGARATVPPLAGSADGAGAPRALPTAELAAGGLRFIGHADGLVEAVADRRTIASVRLHGAVERFDREGAVVIARSVTGTHATFATEGSEDACALVRRLWQDVPVVWRGGAVTPAAPPAHHRCR